MQNSLFIRLSSLVTAPAGRRTSYFVLLTCVTSLMAMSASADIAINDVTARQRWPWNGLVDIDFAVGGATAGDAFSVGVTATYDNDSRELVAKTFAAEPLAGVGQNRITWDLAADYPEFQTRDLRVAVTVTPISSTTPIYMVINLAGGPTAETYPVRYTTTPPAHVQGAADEPCQTTELWMRRITPVSYPFRVNWWAAPDANNATYWGKLTKPYYIGVFELTQKQYSLITGEWPSYFTNETYRASRPLENVFFYGFAGTWEDPDLYPETIGANSPLGKLRAKTGLPFNLPTDVQWEYAARGGWNLTAGEIYRYGYNGVYYGWNDIMRYSGTVANADPDRNSDAASGTAIVGSYLPNDYGLYDILGNVKECLSAHQLYNRSTRSYYQGQADDNTLGMTTEHPIIDPKGTPKSEAMGSNVVYRRVRGGSWPWGSSYCTLWFVASWETYDSSGGSAYSTERNREVGYRLSMTCE